MTERLHFDFSLTCIGEGNGNPLQCSCLENPRDGGAYWAAVYGVAQSGTRLKRLSRSYVEHIQVLFFFFFLPSVGFTGLSGSMVKNPPSSAGDAGLIPWLGRSPGEGNGNPLQYSCLVNPRNRGAWKAIVHGVAEESDMTEWLNNNICHLYLIFGIVVVKSLNHVRLLWPHGPRCRLRCFWFCF